MTRSRSRRRRAGRNRPEVQPAARPRHPARLRPARAGDPHDADPRRHRRRSQDVQVARQPDRRHRPAGGDLRQDDEHPRRGDATSTTGCCSTAARRRAADVPSSRRATPSARSHARSSPGSTSPRTPRAAEQHFDRVVVDKEAPEEIPEARFPCDDGVLHLPGAIAEEFGHLALGGAPPDRPGRRHAGREPVAAGEHDVPCERADGQVLKVGKRRFRRLRGRGALAAPGAILAGSARRAPMGAGSDRSPSEGSPFGEARRSLKTQQHAHLRSISIVVCVQVRPAGGARLCAPEADKSQVEQYPVMVRDHGV